MPESLPFVCQHLIFTPEKDKQYEDMPKIILAIDSFKGCLTSQEVEECAAGEIRRLFPTCQTYSLPAADGGEGMLEALVHITKGHCITCPVHDPLMRPITARYGTTGDGLTAIIETAQASGLPLLSEAERNPMKTTTYGTGELIRHALHQGFRRFLIGIGGSATNDAGLGMLQALGATLHTEQGIKQTCGTGETMGHITHIDLSGMEKALGKAAFTVACDVENPFCGENGAAPIFAPQKGATPEQIRCLDNGMKHLTKIFIHATGTDVSSLPGAGAAGGLGGALHAFLHARLVPGAELLLDAAGFDRQLQHADLVITGEGKADAQTLMGKLPAEILRRATKAGVPTLLIAGQATDTDALLRAGFAGILAVTPTGMSLAEAMHPDTARKNIRNAIARHFTLTDNPLIHIKR